MIGANASLGQVPTSKYATSKRVSDGWEGQPTDDGNDQGSAVRLDDGGYHTLASGEAVEINIFILLKQYDPNGHEEMKSISFIADGTDS